MEIKPYKFKLKKVSSEDERLLRAVYEYLPATGFEGEFLRGIREAVVKHVGEEFLLRLEAVQRDNFGSFLSKLPKPAITVVIGMAPLSRKAILEIDGPIAMSAIDRMLGGHSEAGYEIRALSDAEQGVFQYLILQSLACIHRFTGGDPRVHFRFERFAFGAGDLDGLADHGDGVAVLAFRVKIGAVSGFVRLVLPDPFVEETLLNIEAPDEERPAELEFKIKKLERFAYVQTSLIAEAGRTAVMPDDVMALEEGDVVIFDRSEVKLSGGHLTGHVVLRVGDGLSGGIDAELSVDKMHAHCRITGIHKGE